jgi:hypothetical protein
MWSKRRPIAEGDTRPRCKTPVRRQNDYEPCGRVARPIRIFTGEQLLEECNACLTHTKKLEQRGFRVEHVDRRKEKAQ